jgi:hypothetical protein
VAAYVAARAAASPPRARVTRAQTREAGAQLVGPLTQFSMREGARPRRAANTKAAKKKA